MQIAMCYCYLLLCNLVADKKKRATIGFQLLIAAVLLIALNLAFMLTLVIKRVIFICKKKRHERKLKKQALAREQKYAENQSDTAKQSKGKLTEACIEKRYKSCIFWLFS